MYQALYRKYRPKSFKDVVGQEVIIQTLTNAISNDKVSHAYLFTGPRGTGKTSIAKIYAKMLNCENLKDNIPCEECISCKQINNNQNIDVIEIDAASNNGVDEIREIRNKVGLVPSNSKYKIYIIDEVHMLTTQAFNALLKTLEEPPSHTLFILATTEPHKIPKTILSRCQKFDFKKISDSQIVGRLKHISEVENIEIDDDALTEISILSDGGLRDSIGMLDQAISYSSGKITIEDIHAINGTVDKESIQKLIECMLNHDMVSILNSIEQYEEDGKNLVKITQEIIDELKNILLYCNVENYFDSKDDYYESIKNKIKNEEIYNYIYAFSNVISSMKNSNNNKILLEIEFIKMIDISKEKDSYEHEKKEPKEDKIEKVEVKKETPDIKEVIKEVKKENIKPKVDKSIKLSEEVKNKLDEIKKIRINNSLIKVSQKTRKEFKDKMESLKKYLMDPDYSKIVSLLFDGDLKIISDHNIIFSFKNNLMAEAFNLELINLEHIFEESFGEKYYLIAVDDSEWNDIKEEYNNNKNNYKYIEEPFSLESIYEKEEIVENTKNVIDSMFENFIEYE